MEGDFWFSFFFLSFLFYSLWLVCYKYTFHAIVQFVRFSKSLFVVTVTEGSMHVTIDHAQEVFTAVLPR